MVYKWYISCQLGDGLCYRSHLLGGTISTTIDKMEVRKLPFYHKPYPYSLKNMTVRMKPSFLGTNEMFGDGFLFWVDWLLLAIGLLAMFWKSYKEILDVH